MRTAEYLLASLLMIVGPFFSLQAQPVYALPHSIIYKTKIDYSKYVSVELSADKKSISSYPAPTDIRPELAPVKLKGGYWLSKSGVSPNTAYLAITCEDYSKLKLTPPTVDELYVLIRNKSPMTEIWDCGIRNEMTITQINTLISKNQLKSKCKKIK